MLATLGYRHRLKDVLLRGLILSCIMYLRFLGPRVFCRGLAVAVKPSCALPALLEVRVPRILFDVPHPLPFGGRKGRGVAQRGRQRICVLSTAFQLMVSVCVSSESGFSTLETLSGIKDSRGDSRSYRELPMVSVLSLRPPRVLSTLVSKALGF